MNKLHQQSTSLKFESLAVINKMVRDGEYEMALNAVFAVCNKLVFDKNLKFKFIHMPEIDKLVQEIGRCVYKQLPSTLLSNGGRQAVNLLIATELYQTGGHTRVLEDIVLAARNPTIVLLTDVFDRYASGKLFLGAVVNKLKDASIVVVPKMGMVDKLINILNFIKFFRPASIGILAHHQDVVAYSACNDLINTQQIYVHHADHNPTLGATIKHYIHMDVTQGNQKICEHAGVTNVVQLPLVGKKRFRPYEKKHQFSTAMSGTFNKFTMEGEFAYVEIVKTILKRITGLHFHIGPIPDDYLRIMHAELMGSGIDPARFRYLGPVDSLCDALVNSNVDVYITSAPVGGAKAYVEALGCGIAIVKFKKFFDGQTALNFNEEYSYSGDHLTWETLEELDHALSNIDLSLEFEKSRKYFMLNHDPELFTKLIHNFF